MMGDCIREYFDQIVFMIKFLEVMLLRLEGRDSVARVGKEKTIQAESHTGCFAVWSDYTLYLFMDCTQFAHRNFVKRKISIRYMCVCFILV